jgi:hypothetical protein
MFVTENLKQDIMTTVNKFYATYSDENNRHRFDIKELPREMWRGFAPLFSFADGSTQGGEVLSSDTTNKDYDGQFIQALWKIEPVQEIYVFLNYHYLKFGSKKGITEKEVFVNHIRYSIYPRIKSAVGGQGDVVKDWIDQKIAEIKEIKSQQKLAFLEHAYRYSKGDSATQINMDELKSIIGTDGQIVQELLSIGYIELGAESNMFTLSSAGLKYAERNCKELNPVNNLSIGTIGNNANVQLQVGVNNSHQSQIITKSFISEERVELLNFIKEVKDSVDELKNHLHESEIRDLQLDLVYLENISTRETVKGSVIKSLLKGIGGVLKKVPEGVVSSAILEYIKLQFF